MSNEQPLALRLALALRDGTYLLSQERDTTADELIRLHAEVVALRAALEQPQQEPTSETQPIYCYSLDGEEYHGEFGTREAALAEAKGEAENQYSPGETVKIYTGQQVHAMHFLRGREARIGESIVEQLDEWLIDDIYSEEPILELFKEQHAAFGKHILDFLEAHGSFSKWSVDNVQEHEIMLPEEGGQP